MAPLPERYHSSSPQRWEETGERPRRPLIDLDRTEWRISVRRERGFWRSKHACLLYIIVFVWLLWSTIRDAVYPPPVQLYAPPSQATDLRASRQPPANGPGRYAQPGDPVGPNFENWGNRNHTGVVPRDFFGFNRDREGGR